MAFYSSFQQPIRYKQYIYLPKKEPQSGMTKNRCPGFTLAELLIALAILGVIATFTIPKILSAQQNSQKNAAAHEVIATISGAYDQYAKALGGAVPTTSFDVNSLQPYLNYVKVDTSSTLDDHVSLNANFNCGSGLTCLTMHTGGTLFWPTGQHFNSNSSLDAVVFFYDPDSQRSGVSADEPGKSLCIVLYYNGRITSRSVVLASSVGNWAGTMNPGSYDPSWFSW